MFSMALAKDLSLFGFACVLDVLRGKGVMQGLKKEDSSICKHREVINDRLKMGRGVSRAERLFKDFF